MAFRRRAGWAILGGGLAILAAGGWAAANSTFLRGQAQFSGDVSGTVQLSAGGSGFAGVRGSIGPLACRSFPVGEGYGSLVNYPTKPANFQADLRAEVNSEVYYLNIWVVPYAHPGTFSMLRSGQPFGTGPPAAIVSLEDFGQSSDPAPYQRRGWTAVNGTVTINPGGRGGRLDVQLGATFTGIAPGTTQPPRQASLRIEGPWTCVP